MVKSSLAIESCLFSYSKVTVLASSFCSSFLHEKMFLNDFLCFLNTAFENIHTGTKVRPIFTVDEKLVRFF